MKTATKINSVYIKTPVGRHAVLSSKPQQLEIIHHTDDRRGHTGDNLRSAVAAGLQNRPQLQLDWAQPQQAVIRPQEIEQWEQPTDALAQPCRNGGACHTPAEPGNEQRVQRHIRHPGGDRREQAQLRLFRRNQEALEYILQHICRVESQQNPAIEDAVVNDLRICPQPVADRPA